MQITKFSDYALRVLLHLAADQNRQISAKDIAESQGVSFNHLAKIVQWLAAEGYVTTVRGRGGGMRLARSPDDIVIGQLLRKSEAGSALVECLRRDGGSCNLVPACGLRPMLVEAQEAFFHVLDGKTLADALQGRSGMLDLIRSLDRTGT